MQQRRRSQGSISGSPCKRSLRRSLCVVVAVLVCALMPAAAAAYRPNDPLVDYQSYLATVRAFPWSVLPPLAPVKVAVIDGAIDGTNPELAGKIVASRSWSGRPPLVARSAHATATAGLIAANIDNAVGIAGISPSAQLIVADVSAPDDVDAFPIESISGAVRWAADERARVISISLTHAAYDGAEQAAVDYAYRRGAVIVAASGNCWSGPDVGCRRAERLYPSSLRHVIGVGALGDGARPRVADFSVRDRRYVDVVAPGELVTTLWPVSLPDYRYSADCLFVGTTACWQTGTDPSRPWGPSGTSYAAPIVAAAVSLLFATRPSLSNDQAMALLERTAVDVGPPGRDGASGEGALDIAGALAALAGPLPMRDLGEPNDKAVQAHGLGARRAVAATMSWYDDPVDWYEVRVRRGGELRITFQGSCGGASIRRSGAPDARGVTSPAGGRALRILASRAGRYLVRLSASPGAAGICRLSLAGNQA